MSMFNLVDDPWIPVVDRGRVGLGEIFSTHDLKAIGGNTVQKIAVFKLLQAIAMRAAPVRDVEEWRALGADGMARKCLEYLEKWHHRFFLYGNEPFLQMPEVKKTQTLSYGAMLPDVATGNTTILTQWNMERHLDDGERALLLVFLMGFAFAGKKVDNTLVLTKGYSGKKKSGKAGPSLANRGLLHSFIMARDIQRTIWLNMITKKELDDFGLYPEGVGVPPWEQMPRGEDCEVAQRLKKSLMGRLIPLCRFCLFEKEGLHYTEGIQHMNYLDGIYDPTIAIDTRKKKPKVLWADPEKRPWRQLSALLSFIVHNRGGFDCFQLKVSFDKAREHEDSFAVWSGGLKVRSNAGEQYVTGNDDFVESEVWLSSKEIGELWFHNLQNEMHCMEEISKSLYGGVSAYFRAMKAEDISQERAARATGLYWELCEGHFQELVNACALEEGAASELQHMRKRFVAIANGIYDRVCPNDTARQMEAWARCRPGLGRFIGKKEKRQ